MAKTTVSITRTFKLSDFLGLWKTLLAEVFLMFLQHCCSILGVQEHGKWFP